VTEIWEPWNQEQIDPQTAAMGSRNPALGT